MKNRKVAAYLGIALFVWTAGCGSNGKEPSVPAVEAADTEFSSEGDAKEDGIGQMENEGVLDGADSYENQERPSGVKDGDGKPESGDSAADDEKTETLTGNIRTISEDTLVVSRAFEEEEGVLAAPSEGSSDEVLVSVLVSEDTEYEVKTVKNGGVNGDSDVEVREGAFSDLEKEASVDLVGYFKGEEFIAQKITAYRFV